MSVTFMLPREFRVVTRTDEELARSQPHPPLCPLSVFPINPIPLYLPSP